MVAHAVRRGDGEGRVTLELLRALVSRGHEVSLYAPSVSEEVASEVVFHRLSRPAGPALFADLALFASGTAALRGRRHDVTCVMGTAALPSSRFVHYAHFSHAGWRTVWPRQRPGWYHRVNSHVGRHLERVVCARATAVIACSQRVATELGVIGDRVTVVPNGVDVEEFSPASPAERARSRALLRLPPEAFVVAFVGEHRTPRKGLATAVEAVRRGNEDEHLVVAGSGPPQRHGRPPTEGDRRIHFLGYADVRQVLSAADVAVVPSTYEPFSLFALEAAAAGVPVAVSAAAGAAAELEGACLPLDPPEDPRVLRAALDTIRDDEQLRVRLAIEARHRAVALRWPVVAARAADAIEQAAAR